ncbi:peptidase inhibitor family I36 protein [Conexibacter sp. JD483]|uniref:peptidase inhibitor family I36 protein n=1 Tax=unclassified Conexibacter TaxID=2627773 RepID=UPI00271E10EC|nr:MULTISPECIES: peptidase inhibitor family I36 protein [unclassified Conexibacter]MDO8188562.1 peptidase inhibitor family I36 protein [Conexibacter sp. CPCC 205706]MDO8199945.1 peptidase inhibitor family I36 protein [Conexibacter sp. CPCC 205762]MDR9370695.1 peptidase inhibitor family I36 protein [Conexibacter sp. JD483]
MSGVEKRLRAALLALLLAAAVACALFVTAPKASADRADCPGHAVCIWSGPTFGGQLSWFSENDIGCHPHPDNTPIRSAFNRSTWDVRIGGWGYLQESNFKDNLPNITGEVCWGI